MRRNAGCQPARRGALTVTAPPNAPDARETNLAATGLLTAPNNVALDTTPADRYRFQANTIPHCAAHRRAANRAECARDRTATIRRHRAENDAAYRPINYRAAPPCR